MSGIAGIFTLKGHDVRPEFLIEMTSKMSHRAIDGTDHFVDEAISLGQAMIHVNAQSREVQLPLTGEASGVTLIMDGRVDNWEALRKTLREIGCQFNTHSDAELVLRAYEIWGNACFEKIDGDFAIALWDPQKTALICARDRSSKKPFYYHHCDEFFTFASEMSSLLTLPWVAEYINEDFISERISDSHHSLTQTCWKNIYRLTQAHYMVVDRRGIDIKRYWFPEKLQPLRYKRQEEYEAHYKEILLRAVRKVTRCDKTVSFEVSGGLDSSSLFAVAKHHQHYGHLLTPNIDAFTLNFFEDTEANELNYVDAVADHLGTPITPIDPAFQTIEQAYEFTQTHKTFPVAPNGFMHGHIYKRMKKEDSRVLITGLGGDEWLGGSGDPLISFMMEHDWHGFKELWPHIINEQGTQQVLKNMISYGVRANIPSFVKNALRPFILRREDSYTRKIPTSDFMQRKLEQQKVRRSEDLPDKIWACKKMGTLFNPDIRFANETMEHYASSYGVELRSPFDSREIIEFSLTIPEGRKKHSKLNRDLHRNAMVGLLPDLIRQRNDKADFSLTYDYYVTELIKLKQWQTDLADAGWTDPEKLDQLISRLEGPAQNLSDRYVIWALFGCAALI